MQEMQYLVIAYIIDLVKYLVIAHIIDLVINLNHLNSTHLMFVGYSSAHHVTSISDAMLINTFPESPRNSRANE